VTRQVAYRWKEAWVKGGKAGLASKGKAGRKSRLTANQTEQGNRPADPCEARGG